MNNNQSTWCVPLKYDRGTKLYSKTSFHQATNFFGQIDEGLFYIGGLMIHRLMPGIG